MILESEKDVEKHIRNIKEYLKQIYILLLYIIYIIGCRKTSRKQVEKNNF